MINIHSEKGRSMVEMLATMAIMAIIVISGIAGYRYAIHKNRAHVVLSDAKTAFVTEDANLSPNYEWTRVNFNPECALFMEVARDKIGQILVRVEDIEKPICEHLIRLSAPGSLSLFDDDSEPLTTCEDLNNIIFAFGNVEAIAECGNRADCGNNFDGFCTAKGQCYECDPATQKLNDDATACVCNGDKALTCTDGEETWCCGTNEDGDPLICGKKPNECINGGGLCYYNMAQQEQTKEADCSYTMTQQEQGKAADCSYTIAASGNSIAISAIQGCPSDQYCYLAYTSQDCSTSAGAGATGTLYGTCLQRTAFTSQCNVKTATPVLTEEQGCPATQYCYLKWTDQTCSGAAGAGATGRLYGACLARTVFSATCPAQ